MSLERVMLSQAEFLKHDQESYAKFQDVLNRLRTRKISSSQAAVHVYKFLDRRRYSDVLLALKPFLPHNYSHDAYDFRECIRFLSRLATQYPGDEGSCAKFLNYMKAYSRQELTLSEVCSKVVRLLDRDQELVVEFSSFLPNLRRKRHREDDQDQEIHELPTRRRPKRPRLFTKKEEVDFEMEDSLCYYDTQIGQLESTYENAEQLQRRLTSGDLSPENVPVEEHFSALDLCGIRKIDKQILVNDEMIRCEKLPGLIRLLMEKKEILENSRAKLKDKWNKFRQSRPRKLINLLRGGTKDD